MAREARAAKARAAERRRQEENEANEDALEVLQDDNRNDASNRNDNGAGSKEPDPHNQDPLHEVLMGIQFCGVCDEDAARSLAKNPFVSNFSRCLKVTKEDVEDTFESSERCWPSTAG